MCLTRTFCSCTQDENPNVVSRVRAVAPGDRAISIITVEEQLSGWYTQLRQAKRPEKLAWAYRRLAATVRFLARIEIVDFDAPAIHRYEQLKKHKLKIRKMDLRIAATVLERGAILVTRNLHDFQQVPGPRIEDWSK
jgi:tRNA(fMet)-specific endonuclease VapC